MSAKKSSRDRMKLAVIPLLVLLLAVLCWPSSSDDVPRHPSRDRLASVTATSTGAAAVEPSPAMAIASTENLSKKGFNWPAMDLESIVGKSPFDRAPAIRQMFGENPEVVANAISLEPGEFGSAEESDLVTAAIDYATIGTLQAVLQSESGPVALIDSRIVRPGDLIGGGQYRIVEITPQAVMVEAIVLPPPPDESRITQPIEEGL